MEKKLILIVDDEPDILRLVKFGLEKHGYDVLTATNGQEALELACDEKPDLVLMDIVLKGKMDGIETAGQINFRFNIPVIYLTAYTEDEKLARAKATEPFGYIIKPFEDRELKFAIEIGLYKAEMENALKSLAKKLEISNQKLQASKASFHNIVEKNADGVIVVDEKGIVRFVNPAAEVLFGKKAEDFLGELFSFPVTAVEGTEIDIIRNNRESGTGEMRIIKTDWETKPAYLVSIRDIAERKQAEEAVLESELKFRTLFESANDAIFLMDFDRFIECNKKTVQMYGCITKDQIIGKTPYFFSPAQQSDGQASKEKSIARIQAALGGEPQFFEWKHRRIDDSLFDVEVSLHVIELRGKKFLQAIVRDITERKQAEEKLQFAVRQIQAEKEKTETIIAAIGDAISIQNREFKIIFQNEVHKKLRGVHLGEYCYKAYEYKDSVCDGCPVALSFKNGAINKAEKTVAFENGTRYFDLTASPLRDADGTIIAGIELVRDITERKKAEEVLEQLNKDLRATIEKLSIANRELKEFAHITAHDMKVPLRGIGALAEWLATGYADKFDDEGRKSVKMLTNRVNRLYGQIDNILKFSEIGCVEVEKSEVDLNKLIEEIKDRIAVPENIKVVINGQLPKIICEKTRMTQIFQNLISNAVNYMDKPCGLITVGCADENDFWKFSIADNGPGIEEKYFEKIFKIFQTLATNNANRGTGIGLAIVRKIVELYGGRVWVESKVGCGSTFIFTLPKQKQEAIANG